MTASSSLLSLSRGTWLVVLSVIAALAFLVVAPEVADAAPLRVRVRGAAKISARASREQIQGQAAGATAGAINELVLSGSLNDDAGQPIPLQPVAIRVTREANAHDARVADGLRRAQGCDRTADSGRPARGAKAWGVRVAGTPDAPEIIVVTDEDGRFCFRATLEPDRYRAVLVYSPTPPGLLDGTERELLFDLTRRGLALRFDPTPRVLFLDTPNVTVDAVAILDDDATPRVAPNLSIVLSSEKEEIARATTDASGRAHFIAPGAKLGPPGPGELRVTFAGDAETTRATDSEDVVRHLKVWVKVPASERGELTPGIPEEGIPLTAEVGSSLGPVMEGSVEARVGEVVVGAAPVERGIARLLVTFTAPAPEAIVRLRYVPASPWYDPLPEPSIRVPIRAPSIWSKAPILVAGLAVLAFFLIGRVSAQKSKPEPQAPEPKREEREGKPRIDVLRPAAPGRGGWTGLVVDAHEGTPVAQARVWIERGTFEGKAILAGTETDDGGHFTLPEVEVTGQEEMKAEARLHARHTQAVPAAGDLAIALALRRRAVVARMVAWARRRGPPFDARPEPTPGHVKRAASGDFTAARWADAVERAAFGPGEVDARTEQDVERLAPDRVAEKKDDAERR